jgi:hypothetical protein
MMVSSRSSVTTRSAAARAAVPSGSSDADVGQPDRRRAVGPSEIIATVRPCFCSAWMIRTLCVGVQRATTSVLISRWASASSSSWSRSAAVTTRWPASSVLMIDAIASAVAGWSPVIMMVFTPAWRIRCTAGAALSRPRRRGQEADEDQPSYVLVGHRLGHAHSATARTRCRRRPAGQHGGRVRPGRRRSAAPRAVAVRRRRSAAGLSRRPSR